MDEEDITLWERFTDELSKLDAEKAEAKRKKQKNTQNAPKKMMSLKVQSLFREIMFMFKGASL